MSTFDASQGQYAQQHFTVIEIDLPITTATDAGYNYGTPLADDIASSSTQTYKFTTSDAPSLDESGILRIVTNINETPSKLNSQAGLASRGSGSVALVDVKGDPNRFAPAVVADNNTVYKKGTFLAKLNARNILVNKPLRIKNYRVEADGSVDLVNGAETRHYLIESFDSVGKGKWTLKFKDELSKVNLDEAIFPYSPNIILTLAANAGQTIFYVNDSSGIAVGDTVRITDELIKVSATSNSIPGNFSTASRGANINYTTTLSQTTASAHDADDEVFVCDVCDNENIATFLERVLIDISVDASYIDTAAWETEVATWHPLDKLNTLWVESLDANEVIAKVLSDYLMDMWFDPVAQKIKIAAISQWIEPSATISEGSEIDFESIRRKKEEQLRYTRALVVYNKPNLASDDSVENFKQASIFSRSDLETTDYYGDPKTKRLGFSSLLDKNAADLLVSRYVGRNADPYSYKWTTQEKKLNFSVGDVVNIVADDNVGFNGDVSKGDRAQIMAVTPKYTAMGREYKVSALSYAPVLGDSTFTIRNTIYDLNLHTYVGAPVTDVTMTFVFDGATVGSTDANTPAISAGNFTAGSVIFIELIGGAKLQGKGGDGGRGASSEYDFETSSVDRGTGGNGVKGSTVYDAQGINTTVTFTDGSIIAPDGGDGGKLGSTSPNADGKYTTGTGGDGGNGLKVGLGGAAGENVLDRFQVISGSSGLSGSTTGASGSAGATVSGGGTGGAAGSGIVDNGATVTLVGNTALNYINGNGDH